VSFRVVTANVNGIRATARRGGLEWLAESGADAICLQEVRATTEQLTEVLDASVLADWKVAHAPAPDLGRAGVAVLSLETPSAIRIDVKNADIDGQGRWIECDFDSSVGPVTVVSTYIHSGEVDTPKQVAKFAFLAGVDKRLAALARSANRNGREALVCGDFNIGHREVDIKNWKGNRGKSGFLEEERAHLDRWFGGSWTDLGRELGGEGPGPYTWWSWRGRGFDTDGGWRIDYQIATPVLAGRAKTAKVGKAATYAERWSDHAPLTVDFS
jgi:exodeoxyribonuclease III